MRTIADIRAKFPQYSDLSDTQLADALYKKYYSDLPRSDFDAKIGFAPAKVAPSTDRTWFEAFKDVPASALTGVGGLLQFPGQLVQLVPGLSGVGQALQKPGEAIQEAGKDLKSLGLRAREALRSQAISEAEKEGFLSEFATAITSTLRDPALITSFITEQVPLLLGPAGAARIATKLGMAGVEAAGATAAKGLTGAAAEAASKEAMEAAATRLGRRATGAAIGTGAAMQAGDVGSDTYKEAYKRAIEQGMPLQEAEAAALNAARIAAGGAALTSLGTSVGLSKIGGTAIERALAGRPGQGRVKGFVGESISEGAEEGSGKGFSNLGISTVDPSQSLTQGVAGAAGMGVLGGGIFGAVLSPSSPETLAPGQRPGESLYQTANRLNQEIKNIQDLATMEDQGKVSSTAIRDIGQLFDLASTPVDQGGGYAGVQKYLQTLNNLPPSKERDQAISDTKQLLNRMNVESAERKTQTQTNNVITAKDLSTLGFKYTDPVYKELLGKDIGKPDDAQAAITAIENALQAKGLRQTQASRLAVLRQAIDLYLETIPGGGFYAQPTVEPAGGEGAGVAGVTSAGTTAAGSGTVEPSGVVSTAADVAQPAGGKAEPTAPITEEEITPQKAEVPAEVKSAKDLLSAIDAGGVSLNTAKLNKIARDLGLDVSKQAKPEDTITRIREAVARAESAPIIETPAAPARAEAPAPVEKVWKTQPDFVLADYPIDAEILNLRRIKDFSDRQNMGVDVEGMASDALKASGRLQEVFEKAPAPPAPKTDDELLSEATDEQLGQAMIKRDTDKNPVSAIYPGKIQAEIDRRKTAAVAAEEKAPPAKQFTYKQAGTGDTHLGFTFGQIRFELSNAGGKPQFIVFDPSRDGAIVFYAEGKKYDSRSNIYGAEEIASMVPSLPKEVVSSVQNWLSSKKVDSTQGQKVADALNGYIALDETVTPSVSYLPKDLAGAKPRYSYGNKAFQLQFNSDIDKALYITAQKTPSKRDADYRAWLEKQGFTPEQITKEGQRVREAIKGVAAKADPAAGPINLPEQVKKPTVKRSLAPEVKQKLEPIYKRLEKRVKTGKPEKPAAKAEESEAPKEKTQKEALLERRAELIKQLDGILKKILAKYNLTGVTLNLEEGMEDEGSYSGQIIKLALDLENPVRVLRHESIHALKDMGFFSDAQWKTLVKKAQDEWVQKYLKDRKHTETTSRYDAYVELLTKEGKTPIEVEEAIIEEAIADAFGSFDVNGAPSGLMAAIYRRMKNLFKAIKEAFGIAGIDTAEEIFGKIEKGSLKPAIPMGKQGSGQFNAWKATESDVEKSEAYEEKNGIRPYVSEGRLDLPTKYSIKSNVEKYGQDPILGIPLNKDGTVTVYYHTVKPNVFQINSSKIIPADGRDRIYLTNESSGAKVYGSRGNFDQDIDGSVVLLNINPSLLQIDQEYDDGRKDFFVPLTQGDFFNKKMQAAAIQAPRTKAIVEEFSYKEHQDRITKAVEEYNGLTGKEKQALLKKARAVLKKEHNIGTLMTENGKLEKTRMGDYGLLWDGKPIDSMGLGLAAAQQISEKLSTCPNSAICQGLCLGETSGGNFLYGGAAREDVEDIEKTAFRAGPRMVQYLKTEALIVHPEEFAIVLQSEIDILKKWDNSPTYRKKNKETGKLETLDKEIYQSAVRLNVTSDFRPEMWSSLIDANPDVMFYDYTKMLGNTPIAPNHHLTYSSTGFGQKIDGEDVFFKTKSGRYDHNWPQVRNRLNAGYNVAMAFSSKSALPKTLVDEETDVTYNILDGDDYDARFLDEMSPLKQEGRGVIVGLRNKASTLKEKTASKETDGFFADYDSKRDGDSITVPDQTQFGAPAYKAPGKTIPIEKKSLRSQTPEFKFWFGQSKIVDKDGKPKVMYHGTARDITEFKAKQAGAIFLTDDPEVSTGYSQESATWMADHADEFLTPKQIEDSIKAAKKEMRANGYRPDQIAALEKDRSLLKTDEFRNAASVYMPSAPNIVPLFVKAEYTFDFENPKHVQAVLSQLPKIKADDFKRTNNWTTVENPEVQEVLREMGFDSFYVNEHGKKNLAVYSPTQVKSATGNIGTYDVNNPDIRYSLRSPIGLYSELENKVEAVSSKAAPAGQWKTMIAAMTQKGVKPEEIEWSGVNDWLDLQTGKVAKDDLLEYLKANGVQVEETVLGKLSGPQWSAEANRIARSDYGRDYGELDHDEQVSVERYIENDNTKYGDYTLPGGENYREVLLTLPDRTDPQKERLAFEKRMEQKYGEFNSMRFTDAEKTESEKTTQAILDADGVVSKREVYKSTHWKQFNVIAHIRVNDRTDADGNKVLFVEEIQSDWGQEGKKKGFAGKKNAEKAYQDYLEDLQARVAEEIKRTMIGEGVAEEKATALGQKMASRMAHDPRKLAEYLDEADKQMALHKARIEERSAVPAAPFVTKTEGWLNLALKRIMIMAAEGGYDKVAFVNGEQSADRYDLSKQVNSIAATRAKDGTYTLLIERGDGGDPINRRGVNEDELENTLGKEIAQKIVNDTSGEKQSTYLQGLDLKVGGEGMKTFYDKIVPTTLKKLMPKVGGGEVGVVDMPRLGEPGVMKRKGAPWPEEMLRQQPGFDVTPAMKEKVETTGLPKFSLRSTLPASFVKSMDKIAPPRYEPGYAERMTNAFSGDTFTRLRQKIINRYERLAEYDRRVAAQIKEMGGIQQFADSKAESAALFSDMAAGVLESAMGVHDRIGGAPIFKNGVTSVSNYGGSVKGLIEIFRPLAELRSKDAFNSFQTWAAAKRGTRLNEEGREQLIEESDIKAAKDLAKSNPDLVKLFESVQKDWLAYNNALVKYMRDTGVISPAMAKKYTEHGDYFPFYRLINEEDIAGPKAFSSIGNVRPPGKLKGGENPLGDFFENIVRNSQSAIQAGMKNTAAKRATEQALRLGEVTRLDRRPAQSDVSVYRVFENGEEVFYRSHDPLFIEAIKSLNMADLPFIGLLAKPAALLRNLVTKDPAFMLANMMRDSLSAWATTGVKMTPIVSTFRNFGAALTGTSPELEALYAAGILGGYDYSTGTKDAAREYETALRKKAGDLTKFEISTSPFTSLWGALEKGTQASDAATRIEVYKKVLAETGNEAEALWQAAEVMNFNRKGNAPIIRILTAAVPFLNARMQGLDVLFRSGFMPIAGSSTDQARQRMKTFWVRGMTMFGLSSMYWLLTHDDEEYKKQEKEVRDGNWLIPSLGVKIPIPFEVGVMFKVVPERIMGLLFGPETSKDFTESMKRQFVSTFAVNLIPQVALPFYEAKTNHSFFTDRPIIGAGMENIQDKYQIGPGTSRVAQLIGSSVGYSPMKLDYLIKGYTGTIGTYATDLFDMVYDMNSDSPKPSKRFEQMPVIKRFILDPDARGMVTQYYKLKNEVDSAVRTSNMLDRSKNFSEYSKYSLENRNLLASKEYVNSVETSMKDYRDMKLQIQSAPFSADTKKNLLLAISRMESQTARNIQSIKRFSEK